MSANAAGLESTPPVRLHTKDCGAPPYQWLDFSIQRLGAPWAANLTGYRGISYAYEWADGDLLL